MDTIKLITPLLACLFAFSCSDEFEIRNGIEGRWKIESVTLSFPGPLLVPDSLVISPNPFIDFTPCSRRENKRQPPGCQAEIFMLGITTAFNYRVSRNRLHFAIVPRARNTREEQEKEMAISELFIRGEGFTVVGDYEQEITLQKQGLVLMDIGQPANLSIKLLRDG